MTSSMTPWGPPTTPIGVPAGIGPTFEFKPPRAPHPTLPLAAGLGALLVLTLSLFVSKYVLDLLVDFEWPVAVYVALLAVVGYGPSIAWWWFASERWGSGDRFRDVGATPRWSDLAWGPLVWLATIVVQVFVGAIVLAFDVPLSNNTDDIGRLSADRTYTVAIVIAAVVAAPLVEELVFRGLVMRSLLSKLPAVVAVGLQGILFGVAHVDPVRGTGNIGLAIILSGVGISLGSAAYLLRRIGPTVVAHAIFNGVVMILLLSGIRDRLLEDDPGRLRQSSGSVAEQVAVVDQPLVAEPDSGRDPDRAP
jgi:membrane protease YdiL (CAAX protease family)